MAEEIETELMKIMNYYLPGVTKFKEDIEFLPNIKSKHLKNAIKEISFNQIEEEEVLVIIDGTAFRTFKRGLLIGKNSLYIRDLFDKYNFKYTDITGIEGDNNKEILKIYINTQKAPISIPYILTEYEQFAEFIQKLVTNRTGKEINIYNNKDNLNTNSNNDNSSEIKIEHENNSEPKESIKNTANNPTAKNSDINNSTNEGFDDYVIIDKTKIFKLYILVAILPVISIFLLLTPVIWGKLFGVFNILWELILLFIELPNEKYGIHINSSEAVLKYQRGNLARTKVKIPLSEIQTWEMYEKIDTGQNKFIPFSPVRYVVVFSGRFGTHKHLFHSEFPQQTLYAALNEFCQ